jgi:hypothetical protein
METAAQQNVIVTSKAGKRLGVSGFVISLVALVFWLFVSAAAVLSAALGGGMGLASFWLLFSITGLALSVLGFVKANKAGAKKGLAITGLIIGLIATLLSITTVTGVSKAQDEFSKAGLGENIMETLKAGN